tara:strand:+ start:2335 stop:3099 length:765 start_codon:yes stop_codon:yes gene_type:complete
MTKDINNYWRKYKEIYSFEEILRKYREQKALDFLVEQKAKNILEIGCGFTPCFKKYDDFNSYTVIEPGKDAWKNAKTLSRNYTNVECINDYFEMSYKEIMNKKFDCIISTGVLHETPTPEKFLRTLGALLTEDNSVYLNVPNAKSFHRVIAKEMGLINDIHQKSERNMVLEQNANYDIETLKKTILKVLPEVTIKECKSFFIKPFTHSQMMRCIENDIINDEIIDGLFSLSKYFPEYGCELYCVFSKNGKLDYG